MRSFNMLLCGLAGLALWTGVPAIGKDSATPDPKAADKGKPDKKKDGEKSDKKKDKKKDDKKKDDKKPDDKNQPADPKATGTSGGGRLNLPLVKDHPSLGLKIPYYDVQGNLQMIYTIGTATRIDDDNVEMKEVQVETYNNEGEPDMTVELPTSTLNLNSKVVTSHTKTTISRSDFVLTGDTVQFDTLNKSARLIGHVRMLVFDLKDEEATNPKPDSPEPAAAPNE